MNPPAVTSTIDLEAPGRQVGRLQYPKISNTAGWAYEFVPIAVFANGEGPTVVVYPDGIWYRGVRQSDAHDLVHEHLLGDRLVARLVDNIMQ